METLQALTGRHGVLRYKPMPVEAEKIERVLRAATSEDIKHVDNIRQSILD